MGKVLPSGKVRVTVRTNAKKVKVTYRTNSGAKRTKSAKVRKGKANISLPSLVRAVTAKALATSRLKASPTIAVVVARATANQACTIVGTPGNDRLVGTPGADVLCGLGGDDVLIGAGGSDSLDGGSGNDTLTGGTEADTMFGGTGTDTVSYAERSTPVVVSLPAPGTLASTRAGTLSTLVAGEGGSLGEGDRLSGDIEVLVGGSADDTLTGNDAPNVISGAGGNDIIGGSGGNDSVSGGAGNDALSGGPGVDIIDGGEGTNVCDRNEGEAEVASCQYDVSPPVLVAVDGPAVATAGTSVTFTYRLTDAIGVSNANLFIVTSSGQFVPGCVTSTRASGSALDGTYTSTCHIPGALADGAYRVTIYAVDLAGNTRYANDAVAILTVTGGTNDTDAPALTSVAGPGSATAGSSVTITYRLTDASGVSNTSLSMVGPNGQLVPGCAMPVRTSGSAQDGQYSATCQLPGALADGTYLFGIYAVDVAGNTRYANETVATLAVSGGTNDSEAPVLVSVDGPGTAPAGAAITFTYRLTDASGVANTNLSIVTSGGQLVPGCQVANLTSGSAQDGVYSSMCQLPGALADGTYRVSIYAVDVAGNTRYANNTDATLVVTRSF